MTTLDQQESLMVMQSQYDQNQTVIEGIQRELEQKVASMARHDVGYAEEYIHDKVNLFRFLKDSDFDASKTTQRLLETLQWRREKKIHALDYHQSVEFCPVAFFRHHDKLQRPLLFVNLRHYPTQSHSAERILPYASLMMEIARKLTLEKTLTTHSLVSQVMVVVDIQQAPFVSIHREIVQTMELVLSVHFPGMIASINVMNFGWLYQGLWSILQCFLNQEQKDAIRFIRLQQLKKAIDTDFIPQALGGADTDQWTLASDPILQQYGKPPELPNTPPASVTSPSEDVFFDALQSPTPAQALSIRNSSRSSRSSPSPRPTIQPQDILLFWRKPPVRPTPRRRESSVIVVAPPTSIPIRSTYLAHGLSSLQPILSWAGLYLLIRGPVETIAYRFLSQLFIPPRLLTKATLALSATTAALLSTSLATTLDHLNTP